VTNGKPIDNENRSEDGAKMKVHPAILMKTKEGQKPKMLPVPGTLTTKTVSGGEQFDVEAA